MSEVIVVLCTCGDDAEANRIAATLVTERLAACVNIVPGVKSVYRWQGRIETASEHLLLIKTTSENWERLESRLIELHSYDTPEILRLPVAGGSEKYLDWLKSEAPGGKR